VVGSIAKGQRIVVAGRLRVRAWESGDRAGTNVEIDADAMGHDLSWGTAVFTRSVSAAVTNDGDGRSDRAAGLDESGEVSSETATDSANEAAERIGDADDHNHDVGAARSKRPLEVALPF
jgi:single-strand DNA-binding protein